MEYVTDTANALPIVAMVVSQAPSMFEATQPIIFGSD